MSQPISNTATPPHILAVNFIYGSQTVHVYPYQACQEGVFLAADQVDNIYDAPVKTTWKSGAFQVGSTQKAVKRLHRDMILGFHIKESTNAYEFNESTFRQMFDYQIDPLDPAATPTTLAVQTSISGWRYIDVLLYEQPEFKSDQDPIYYQYGNLILKLRAGDPNWRSTLSNPSNPSTTSAIDPSLISSFSSSATNALGFVTVSNPTDQWMFQKWICTVCTPTLPDFQWVGAKGQRAPGGANGNRSLTLAPITPTNGGAVIDLDGSNLMIRDAHNTNILGQQGGGNFFTYPIPPYTPPTSLPVAYTGAPSGGAMIQLIQPQKWSRPWGLELPTATALAVRPMLSTISVPGSYVYTIPPWADTLDIITLGAGGGGNGGGLTYGQGGTSGAWQYATVVRGVGIPWSSTTISGVIGTGGTGGGIPAGLGGNGTSTTATATGMTTLTASGGTGGGWANNNNGQSPGTLSFNGNPYVGGAVAQVGQPGWVGGGGGAGGFLLSPGGAGASGQVWFLAYQTAGGS